MSERVLIPSALFAAVILFAPFEAVLGQGSSASPPQIAPHFSKITETVVAEIAAAKKQIHVQAYNFTSAPIARALIDASRRGVKVIVILDASNRAQKYSAADFLAHEGAETYIDSQHAIAHSKVMIIDDAVILTGSFNFTKAAEENNAENLIVIRNGAVASSYEKNWQEHFAHSEYYAGK